MSIDGFGYEMPKLSKQGSRVEDVTISEAYLNVEINNILKNMDKIVGQKVDDLGGDFDGFSEKENTSINYDFNSQTSAKCL
jgi:hypothetical protein